MDIRPPSLGELYAQDLIALQHTLFLAPMRAIEAAEKRTRLRGAILDMEGEMLLTDPEGLEEIQREACDLAAQELGYHRGPMAIENASEEYAAELEAWCFEMWERCGKYLPAVWRVCTLH